MDSVSSLAPTLRIDKLQFAQGNKQQHPPFARGQILQGLITGKENNQFILDVKGQQFLADSKAPLQIGQRLDLQVTALSPRISLQVLTDPLTQNIGKALYLLPTEGRLLTQTATLAGELPANSLSPPSQQALDFFTSLAVSDAQSTPLPQQAGQQLSRLLINLFSAPEPEAQIKNIKNALAELQSFIDRLTQSLPRQHPARILAERVRQSIGSPGRDVSLQQLMATTGSPEGEGQLNALLQNISQLPTSGNTGQTLTELVLQFMLRQEQSPTPLLQQLLSLTEELLRQDGAGKKGLPSGKELEQFVNRLGTNLEQLLATGRKEEATQTLKSALLEISHTFSENTKIQPQADQLTATIELYQMLQIRLAGETVFFLPLPLSFVNQGYLLVEPDKDNEQEQQPGAEGENNKYSLHLNLEGLGNLKVELQQHAGGTRLRFFAEDSEKARFLSENRDDLQQWLTATTLESVQFLTGAEDPTRQLLARMTHGPASLLNTRA